MARYRHGNNPAISGTITVYRPDVVCVSVSVYTYTPISAKAISTVSHSLKKVPDDTSRRIVQVPLYRTVFFSLPLGICSSTIS